jgi:hypothetical protein
MNVQDLSDKIEIQEQLARYARGVDTGDWALWKSVFTPDATIDYTSTSTTLPVGNRDQMAEWLEHGLGKMPMKQHFISNIEIDLDGDRAKVIAMFLNPMRLPGATDQSCCGGYYHHEFVRTTDGWKSRSLVEDLVWFTNPPRFS